MIYFNLIMLVSLIEPCKHSLSILSLDIALWIALFSLLFAISTYWYDKIQKYIVDRKTKEILVREIRLLYRVVCIDILKYKSVKESRYSKNFEISVYNFPIIKHLVANNKLYKYFKKDDYPIGLNIYQTLNLIEKYNRKGFYPPIIPDAINWFFENRVKELREELLKLVQNGILIRDLQPDRENHRLVNQFISSNNMK